MKKTKTKQKLRTWADATPEEKREAWKMGALWASDELEGKTVYGAFSEANLGEDPIVYFPMRAYKTLKDPRCKWKWNPGTKLSTLFINVMKSDMAHTLRDYMLDGAPLLKANSEFERDEADEDGFDDSNDVVEVSPEDREAGFQVKSQMELLEELQQKESKRDAGYKIARAAAKGDAQFEKYVEAVFTLPDQRSICKRMKMTKAEVEALEAELIVKIKLVMAK